jgi:hypothetical protein
LEARGNLAEMKKYFGTAKLANLIADKTRKLEPKQRNRCEGINDQPPHNPAAGEGPLGFRHNPWKSRLAILEDVLAKYREGEETAASDAVYYIPDMARFEDEFIEAHLPWSGSGKILCVHCDREWTRAWLAGRNSGPAMPPEAAPGPMPRPDTIEKLTVELIFRGLSNAEVLAGVRQVFPERASLKTVAWYRSRLIHNRSERFERLRAGRVPPASPR